ncbi:hypothetical protein XI00_06750 [Bradyrhizobium sp. CCBAU 21359]|nr:hypothetical protein [Bradyrhizobium sp. CCBAU 21359]
MVSGNRFLAHERNVIFIVEKQARPIKYFATIQATARQAHSEHAVRAIADHARRLMLAFDGRW